MNCFVCSQEDDREKKRAHGDKYNFTVLFVYKRRFTLEIS